MNETKEKLLMELKTVRAHEATLEEQLKTVSMYETMFTSAKELGGQLKASIDGLVASGLTESQAWEIIMAAAVANLGGTAE